MIIYLLGSSHVSNKRKKSCYQLGTKNDSVNFIMLWLMFVGKTEFCPKNSSVDPSWKKYHGNLALWIILSGQAGKPVYFTIILF